MLFFFILYKYLQRKTKHNERGRTKKKGELEYLWVHITLWYFTPIDSILHIRGYVRFLVITYKIIWLIIMIKVIEKKVQNMKSNNMT